jgi:hypothetical protein
MDQVFSGAKVSVTVDGVTHDLGRIDGSITLKCKPSLGKLNRLTKAAQSLIAHQGHATKRFKRDYDTGTASYECPNCGARALVVANPVAGETKMQGEAIKLGCVPSESQK